MDQEIKTVIQYPVGATEFDIPFDYLSRKFVRVSLVADENRRLLNNITEYRYVSKTRVRLLVETTGFDRVEIRRFTSASERIVDFSDGSVLRANDLNVSQLQSAHIAEEARDAALLAMPQDDAGNLDARNRRIVRLAPGVSGTDAVNKNQLDTTLGEAGGILADVKQTEKDIQDYIEKFADDTAMVRGVAWVYNNGSALGGESILPITKPTEVFAVPYIEINGSRQEVGYHYSFDIGTQSITLAKPLAAGDFVMAMTTESHIPLESMLLSQYGASSIGTKQGGTVQDSLTRVSVLTFGAKGDGYTDDTEAFIKAWQSHHSHILVPDGYTFVITGEVGSLTTPKAKKWCGEPGAKIIIKGSGKFSVTGIGWGFDSLHFIPSGVVPVCIQSGVLQSNRFSQVTDCDFRGVTSGSRFDICLDLYNVWYSKFSNININNSGQEDFSKQVVGGKGIRMSYCVNNNITDCQIGSCEVGIELTDTPSPSGLGVPHCCEGIFISESTLIANWSSLVVSDGYFIKVSSNVIDIPLPTTTNPVVFKAMSSQLTDNWISTSYGTIYVGKGTSGLSSYDGSGNIISRNTIRSSSSATHVMLQVGPIGITTIQDNNITFGGYGIKSDGGANWQVTGNTFAAQSIMAYDLHLTTLSRIGPNKVYSGGTPSKSVSDSSVLSPTVFSSLISTTLVDGAMGENKTTAPQSFDVDVPSGYFVSVPNVAMATLATGTTLGVARYVRGESSPTRLRFSFVGIGGSIVAGQYAFSIIATDRNSAF